MRFLPNLISIRCCINKNYIYKEENFFDVKDKKGKINVYLRVRKYE